MSEASNDKPGMTFWALAGFFLVFNLSGLMIYYMQVTVDPEFIANNYSAAEQAFLTGTPVWATSAFALAVTAGVIASGLMLLRRAWAVPLFVLSLVCVILQNLDAFVLRNGLEVWGASGVYMPTVIILIGVVEIWYTRRSKASGWLI